MVETRLAIRGQRFDRTLERGSFSRHHRHTDVRRASLLMRRHALANGLFIAPRYQAVYQAIASTIGEIRVAEPHTPEAVQVIGKGQIEFQHLAPRPARLGGIFLEQGDLLDADPLIAVCIATDDLRLKQK